MPADTGRVRFHRLLGSGMQLSLSGVQIAVSTETSVLSDSPRVDILLLRREGEGWTAEQRARLPDGIRRSAAAHVLVEFKYSESVNEDGLLQTAAYDLFYRQAQRLSKPSVLPVVLSAKTPQSGRLASWGYEEVRRGVFRSNLPFVRRVMLLALNRLPPRPNNAIVKLFASRAREREAGFASLDRSAMAKTHDLYAYVLGLRQTLEAKGEWDVAEEITPEKVLEYGKRIRRLVFETGTAEERLEGLAPEERLAGLAPEERLAGLNAEDRRALLRLLQEELDAAAAGDAPENGASLQGS